MSRRCEQVEVLLRRAAISEPAWCGCHEGTTDLPLARRPSRVNPMRSADRIEPMLALLREAWDRNPDQRLGQLVGNAARDHDREPGDDYRDPFNVEDDQLRRGLERMAHGG